jgi:hypothetical protein
MGALNLYGSAALCYDQHGLMAGLGALATEAPQLVLEVLDSPAIRSLGWLCVPAGRSRDGQPTLVLRIDTDHATREEKLYRGERRRLELAAGARATLSPSPGLDIGAGRGRPVKLCSPGYPVTLLVDART